MPLTRLLPRSSLGLAILAIVALMLALGIPRVAASASGGTRVPSGISQCQAGLNCANLSVEFLGSGGGTGNVVGSGTVTTPGGEINCSSVLGTSSGTCSSNFAWSGSAPSLTVQLAEAPAAGSRVCASQCVTAEGVPVTVPVVLTPGQSQFESVIFRLVPYTLSVTRTGVGTGTVTSSPIGIDCGTTCSAAFEPGGTVTLTAIPDAGAAFTAWTGACAGQGSTCTLTLTTDGTTNAVFSLATASPTPTATPGPTPTSSPGGPEAAQISLTTTPSGSGSPSTAVITWGAAVTLRANIAGAGANRPVQFEVSKDQLTWSAIASATTDSLGTAATLYRPSDNRYYRVTFAGAADLGASSSPTARVVVRSIVLLRPAASGTKVLTRGTAITFTAVARPNRPELPQARAEFEVFRVGAGSGKVSDETVAVDRASGFASLTIRFSSIGMFEVRVQLIPTPVNANSGWSAFDRFAIE